MFTHIELYGGTHMAVNGTRSKVETKRIYGDDTAHLHIGPGQTVEINEVWYKQRQKHLMQRCCLK